MVPEPSRTTAPLTHPISLGFYESSNFEILLSHLFKPEAPGQKPTLLTVIINEVYF